MQQGYIKLHRQLMNWRWYTNIPVKTVFLHCLLRANHVDSDWQNEEVKKGSFITSYDNLAKETGLSTQQVRTAISKLKSTNEITYQSNRQYSIITVNNWDKYQDSNKPINKRITNEQQTNNKRITTDNNIKNDKNNKNDKNYINAPNPNNIFNPIVKEFHNQMKDVLHYNIRLNGFQCDKVVELNQRVPDFATTIPIVFERLKGIQWNFNDGSIVNADVNWLLDKENYISVLNGKFTSKQQIIQEKLRRKELENERR